MNHDKWLAASFVNEMLLMAAGVRKIAAGKWIQILEFLFIESHALPFPSQHHAVKTTPDTYKSDFLSALKNAAFLCYCSSYRQ